jgi:hypothetical protein
MIRHARELLVSEKVLHPEVLGRPVKNLPAYVAGNVDWRYLSAAALFEK